MITPDRHLSPHSGLCWFGMQKLPGLLDAFTREMAGVREAQDIEYIHRMRVASRRLRAALPLFRQCFEDKQFKKWMKEITRITRALGEARDADVQIAFLLKTLKKVNKKSGIPATKESSEQQSMEPAIRFLLADLQNKRRTFQEHVTSSLDMLEKSGMTGEMQQAFLYIREDLRAPRKRPRLFGIPLTSAFRIGKRLTTFLRYEPWVFHPEAVAEHHAMRIAAKKLRYTMEIFGPLYRNNLKKPLARVKRVQEILGEIHDCDVWIDHITSLLLRERSLLRGKGTKRPDTVTLASLRILLLDRERERIRLYRQFVRYWRSLGRENIWDDLRTFLHSGRKSLYRPPIVYNEADAFSTVSSLSLTDLKSRPHRLHVTDLALMLFDDLQDLHTLGAHDRFLLSCAGLLHNSGQKSMEHGYIHPGTGIFFADNTLPFDIEERAVLAFIVRATRGKIRLSADPILDLISPELRKRTLMLASLLRIADGLDSSHAGLVNSAHCRVTDDIVSCTVSGTGNFITEKENAQGRSDLFLQVFGKPLVIS